MPPRALPEPARLWTVRLDVPAAFAEAFGDNLGADASALTVIAPPRTKTARVEAIFEAKPDKAHLTASLAVTAALLKTKLPKIEIKEVPSLDWLQKVAADFPPLPVARWVIHGGQHRKAVPDRRRGLEIDATSAFGTGEHPTTRGCLMMLDKALKRGLKGRRMLDMGAGSGVLAMAWAKSRRGLALGVDNHAPSVRIARDNARLNGLQSRVRAIHGHGYKAGDVRRHGPYDLIMANIFARPLAQMARDLRCHLRPGGTVILSGLLNYQANMVLSAHRLQRIYAVKCFRIGEWSVLVLQRR